MEAEEVEEIKAAPEFFADQPKLQKQELEEVDLTPGESSQQPIFVAKELEDDEKQLLVALLKEYRDGFAWDYEEMPGMSSAVTVHKLDVLPVAKPIEQ
ncbi:hypothetical protein Acr_11g0009990 [Actinidia rufa]|uniref:Uncharacterized protein n=1 Tax=Actinidia rufa TaxID=165716 RepID=A0A7J0FDN3_9ERIC|nr:hypothetical protein Acr_11g0009990 [Actinidia rufa]